MRLGARLAVLLRLKPRGAFARTACAEPVPKAVPRAARGLMRHIRFKRGERKMFLFRNSWQTPGPAWKKMNL